MLTIPRLIGGDYWRWLCNDKVTCENIRVKVKCVMWGWEGGGEVHVRCEDDMWGWESGGEVCDVRMREWRWSEMWGWEGGGENAVEASVPGLGCGSLVSHCWVSRTSPHEILCEDGHMRVCTCAYMYMHACVYESQKHFAHPQHMHIRASTKQNPLLAYTCTCMHQQCCEELLSYTLSYKQLSVHSFSCTYIGR